MNRDRIVKVIAWISGILALASFVLVVWFRSPHITEEQLRNIRYYVESDSYPVQDGTYKGTDEEAVELFRYTFGDLNGDGLKDALVVLILGREEWITAVVNVNGEPKSVSSIFLGLDVGIQSLVIKDGKAIVSLLTHGKHDASCCPTVKKERIFVLQGEQLVEPPKGNFTGTYMHDDAASYGQNKFTGVFVGDSRPREVLYLSLTQTGDMVSGLLVIVTPDKHGSTKIETVPLQGTTDGDAITLTAKEPFQDFVINGRKQGETVVLVFPTDSGNMLTVTFLPTTDRDYNLLLSQWQEELAVIYKEEKKLTELANTLANDIEAVKSTDIKINLADMKYALGDEQSALHDLENDLAQLKDDASVRPMTCYQANSRVDYDYNSRMAYRYSSRLGYAHDKFMARLKELETRLSNVEPLITKTRQDAHALDQAIKESKYPLPKLNAMPGDEEHVLKQYQALVTSARNELPHLKAAHSDILNKAKGIMREGEAILKKTQASVRCD